MLLLWPDDDGPEEMDPDNVILLDSRRKTVKVQMDEELEVIEDDSLDAKVSQVLKDCAETDKLFAQAMEKR